MSIMQTIFGGNNQQPAAQPNPTATAPTNPTIPASAAPTGPDAQAVANPPSASPMDAYKDLWQPVKTDAGSDTSGLFNLDSAKLMEAVKGADFTKQLDQELISKALGGDAAAFSQAMNGVAQQAFASQMMATQNMVKQAMESHSAKMQNDIPNFVKRAQVSDSLSSNPLFQHEATRPLLAALESQLTAKNPTASASQITEMAQTYIKEFANAAGGNKAANVDPAAAKLASEFDFSSF